MKILQLLLLVSTIWCVESLKVLICFPMAVRSISFLGEAAVRHLLNAGHEVTYITVYPLKNPPSKNYRQVDISNNTVMLDDNEQYSMGYVLKHKLEGYGPEKMQEFASENAKLTFDNENVKKLLADHNESFDVVIADLFETEVYSGLAVLYDCPMIWLYSMGAHWQVLRMIDEAKSPAYDPDYLSPYMGRLSFAERVDGLKTRIGWQFYKTFFTMPVERGIYETSISPLVAQRGRIPPDYEDVIFNASLIFGNEHNAVKYRPSTPQNFKYIGGFHIEENVKPLPKDLQDIMDNAKHGVIYFSMGSFWKTKSLPMTLVRAILDTLGSVKETVIWKYEDDLPDVPKNVRIVNWAPQHSILAHPNLKFFISHGGLLSSIEAVHFGVPIIGIPVIFDQYTNIKKAVDSGYAILIPLNYDTPKNLKSAMEVMLNTDRYTKKAKELSAIYHDRPLSAGAELVHWVQHVVRTRGALHLRSPALHVPLYQRLYLDLLALLVAICIILHVIFMKVAKMFSKVDSKKKTN